MSWKLYLRVLRLRLGSYFFPKWGAKEAENLFLTPTRIPRPLTEKDYFESARKSKTPWGVQVFEWGPAQGPLVGLFHGWSGRGTQMGAFAQPLVEKGFRVLAIDAPGHGASEGDRLHVGLYAQIMLALEKDYGPFYATIAHSFGTGCTVLATVRGLHAQKLVLIAGPAKYSRVVDMFFKKSGLSPRSQKVFLENLERMVGLHSKDIDVPKLGQKTKAAALVVHDEGDTEVLFRSALEIKNEWPGAELLTTTGLGHRRLLRDPAVVQTVTSFICS